VKEAVYHGNAQKKSKKKTDRPGKAEQSNKMDLKSISELVESLKGLHRWQGTVLDNLMKQTLALLKAKRD
jgi:hypothetical protein